MSKFRYRPAHRDITIALAVWFALGFTIVALPILIAGTFDILATVIERADKEWRSAPQGVSEFSG